MSEFSSTDSVNETERLLESVRDIFAAVFFFWTGLVTDPSLFAGVVGLVAAAVVVTTPTKFLSGFWSGKIYGLDDRRSTRVGLVMSILGTMFMQHPGAVERRVVAWRGDASE